MEGNSYDRLRYWDCNLSTREETDRISNQIKSNQIYLPAQNIKEKQLKNIRLIHKKSTIYRL